MLIHTIYSNTHIHTCSHTLHTQIFTGMLTYTHHVLIHFEAGSLRAPLFSSLFSLGRFPNSASPRAGSYGPGPATVLDARTWPSSENHHSDISVFQLLGWPSHTDSWPGLFSSSTLSTCSLHPDLRKNRRQTVRLGTDVPRGLSAPAPSDFLRRTAMYRPDELSP